MLGLSLLERAVDYTQGSLRVVTRTALCRPTPCAGWTLGTLLAHLDDSLRALREAADGDVALAGRPSARAARTPLLVRDTVADVLTAWRHPFHTQGERDGTVEAGEPGAVAQSCGGVGVGDRWLSRPVVAAVGAMEVAVHGWDVAAACGEPRPMPDPLAEELLDLAPLFVAPADRPGRFAPAVQVMPYASAHDRLLAYLGRDPHH
ncbi:TIGR03086 family metal-binding protein [Nonomuraea pusilla]|uniref:TIGR03086 family protein n=1 Tax=Nonomuraea pusilla TaxID=46177 RepID=A0A1H8E4E9_9ACTN|nr:TIGR03086 family metal-binding protein [Nonomuraea pusilla]SEN14333.1 TIGR03086 family protein [Nonomuraea pusilla]